MDEDIEFGDDISDDEEADAVDNVRNLSTFCEQNCNFFRFFFSDLNLFQKILKHCGDLICLRNKL